MAKKKKAVKKRKPASTLELAVRGQGRRLNRHVEETVMWVERLSEQVEQLAVRVRELEEWRAAGNTAAPMAAGAGK